MEHVPAWSAVIDIATTRSLLSALATGDESALERLFRDWYPRLADHAHRLLGERDLAEDAAQEVFVALWRGRSALPEAAALAGYLHRAVRNRALNQLRQRRGEQFDPDGSMVPSVPAVAHAQLEADELQAALDAAIGALPPRTREIFLLSRQQGLTYSAIAATLEISVKTVETLMGRAIAAMRVAVEP
jgi:RNA polymerase sigma-70 factor (ECF subfamily)